jgi:hypothetical protein
LIPFHCGGDIFGSIFTEAVSDICKAKPRLHEKLLVNRFQSQSRKQLIVASIRTVLKAYSAAKEYEHDRNSRSLWRTRRSFIRSYTAIFNFFIDRKG